MLSARRHFPELPPDGRQRNQWGEFKLWEISFQSTQLVTRYTYYILHSKSLKSRTLFWLTLYYNWPSSSEAVWLPPRRKKGVRPTIEATDGPVRLTLGSERTERPSPSRSGMANLWHACHLVTREHDFGGTPHEHINILFLQVLCMV
jgi:hypothetical protein